MLHPESSLKIRTDLDALEQLDRELEQTEDGARIAEAISYSVTQAMLNVYNHAAATQVTVRAILAENLLEVTVIDDGHGFDPRAVPPEKTSMFKAQLKTREAGGSISILSVPYPQQGHGTTVRLRIPVPPQCVPLVEHSPVLESR